MTEHNIGQDDFSTPSKNTQYVSGTYNSDLCQDLLIKEPNQSLFFDQDLFDYPIPIDSFWAANNLEQSFPQIIQINEENTTNLYVTFLN